MDKEINLKVSKNNAGERLDRFICNFLPGSSRTFIQNLIENNMITVNKKNEKAGYKLRVNDEIFISFPEAKTLKALPEDIKLEVVFEDKDLIVINKPQGMITHPAETVHEGTLVNALLYHCKNSLSGINGVLRPGIVHRLDKDTSGLIIVCKNDKSHKEIAKQIEERTLKRSYYAIVHGKVEFNQGTVNKPIGRDKIHRHKMAVIKNGRNAITHFKVLKTAEKYSLFECNLETGRTHQIRVHMASIGHPVVGDKTYGKKTDKENKMMLHAYKLIFKHPTSKKQIKLETSIPERFKQFLSWI